MRRRASPGAGRRRRFPHLKQSTNRRRGPGLYLEELKMSYFYCFGWAVVLVAEVLALAAWIAGAVSVCLWSLVVAVGVSALLVEVSWVYLKINK